MPKRSYVPGALSNLLNSEEAEESLIESDADNTLSVKNDTDELEGISLRQKRKRTTETSEELEKTPNADRLQETPSASSRDGAVRSKQQITKGSMSITADSDGKKKKHIMTMDEKQRTIFVGNLPGNVDKKELRKIFKEKGIVETIRIRSAVSSDLKLSKRAAVITKQLKPDHLVNAYVKFKSPRDAKAALCLNGILFGSNRMRVDSCAGSKKYDEKRTIFVGNMPYNSKEDELFEHFADSGDIEAVRIVRDKRSGEGKGFGFVSFMDSSSVALALKLNGHLFKNRELRLTKAVKKPKKKAIGSYGGRDKSGTRTSKPVKNSGTSVRLRDKGKPKVTKPQRKYGKGKRNVTKSLMSSV